LSEVTVTNNLPAAVPQVIQTKLDRAISRFFPAWGLERMRNRTTMLLTNQFYGSMGAYDGASVTRRETNSWIPFASDADTASVLDLPALRARSRDANRNQPIAGGALATVGTNVVGPGLSLHCQIDADFLGLGDDAADAWQIDTERKFALWAESQECDVTRTQNFFGLQALAFNSCLENGDVFTLMPRMKRPGSPFMLKLQLIEADRISNPNFGLNTTTRMAGVERDEAGAPIGYWIQKQHPGAAITMNWNMFSWDYYAAFGAKTGQRNVIHLYDKARIGQTRGIPYLAPILEPLKMLGRYTQAELMAAVVSGMFSVFVKTAGAQGLAGLPTAPGANPVVTLGQQNVPDQQKDLTLGNGLVLELNPGESIETANPGRPNTAFDGFVQSIVRQIGMRLEIPYEVLVKHYESSYSAARAAMLDAWKFFNKKRQWLADSFCQLVYEAWLDEAIAAGFIEAPGYFSDPFVQKAYRGALWIGPPKGQIDELKEVNAAEKRNALGYTTAEEETMAFNGSSWAMKQRRRIKERQMREEAGLPTPGAAAREMLVDQTAPDNKKTEQQEVEAA